MDVLSALPSMETVRALPPRRLAGLAYFCLAAVLLIPVETYWVGGVVWAAAALLLLTDREPAVRRRMGVLLGALAVLTLAPIHTGTSTPHFVALGLPFLLVILGPALILGRTDPGIVRFRLWPRRLRWIDLAYVLVSIPLAWLAFELYFQWLSPEVPNHWFLPTPREMERVWRLFVGINAVGMWDELFFVNTVFAVLRSMFPMRIANPAQAVVYAAVLNDMAFTGVGPVIVFLFALTQGTMFEETDNLLYVLVVHLIVDVFLFAAILNHYYPGFSPIPS